MLPIWIYQSKIEDPKGKDAENNFMGSADQNNLQTASALNFLRHQIKGKDITTVNKVTGKYGVIIAIRL